ncbi:hypothetical protein Tco_1035738, partial [Tanacetum coccineum]
MYFRMAMIESQLKHKSNDGWDLFLKYAHTSSTLYFCLYKGETEEEVQGKEDISAIKGLCIAFRAGKCLNLVSFPEPPVRQPSVESSNLEKPDNPPIVTMADNRTMAQLLEAPTEGYEDSDSLFRKSPENNFEIKQ